MKTRQRDALLNAVPALGTPIDVGVDRKTLVDIKANVNAVVLAQIQEVGGDIFNSFPQYQAIRARIPINQIEVLAAKPDVESIRPADLAITNQWHWVLTAGLVVWSLRSGADPSSVNRRLDCGAPLQHLFPHTTSPQLSEFVALSAI